MSWCGNLRSTPPEWMSIVLHTNVKKNRTQDTGRQNDNDARIENVEEGSGNHLTFKCEKSHRFFSRANHARAGRVPTMGGAMNRHVSQGTLSEIGTLTVSEVVGPEIKKKAVAPRAAITCASTNTRRLCTAKDSLERRDHPDTIPYASTPRIARSPFENPHDTTTSSTLDLRKARECHFVCGPPTTFLQAKALRSWNEHHLHQF